MSSGGFAYRLTLCPFLAATGLLLVLTGCNDDDDAADTTTTVEDTTTTTAASETTTTEVTSDLLTLASGSSAEAAADTFMEQYFPDAAYTLAEFRAGDARSGEIDVFGGGEGGGGNLLRSTLLVRETGDGWVVLAAVNPMVAITSPEAQGTVAAGTLTVDGVGRGFEAAIVVRAVLPGGEEVATAVGSGGALEEPAPFSADLEVGAVPAGDTVAIIAAGGTGLEDDPGEFSAVPVVVVIVD